MISSRYFLLFPLVLFTGDAVAQQAGEPVPRRPQLVATADPNDWESYYDWAVERVRERSTRAYDGFYWAARLDPSRAEPLLGMWVGFWMRERNLWVKYVSGDESVFDAPDVRAIRAVRYRAVLRNPMAFRGLEVVLLEQLPGKWRDNNELRAWEAYGAAELPRAVDLYGRAIARRPERNLNLRYSRALAFAAMNRADSALAELSRLLQVLRSRDEQKVVDEYESKEMIEYAIGYVQLGMNQHVHAVEAFERALLEDASFYAAHLMLGTIAMRRRESERAMREFEQAASLAPRDAWVVHGYATALARARRDGEAADRFRHVVELEPWWADAWLALANSLDRAGRAAEAAEAYGRFVEVAPRRAAGEVQRARGRIAALLAAGG